MAAVSEKEAKKALRKQIKDKVSALGKGTISAQSKQAQSIILSIPQYKDAKRIGIYLSMPKSEAQTDLLIQDAFRADKKVFVPYLHSVPTQSDGKKRKIMEMLRLNSLKEYESLAHDSWGIPSLGSGSVGRRENAMGAKGFASSEDGSDGANEGLDLIVVPGVAFDREGARTGHGAGFYDAFLSRFCADGTNNKPYLVGLCLAEQLLGPGQIVMQDHDWTVDAVAVGDGGLHVRQ
ncbi:hypothetical protein DOTSEDRAFT_129178 [Dothistroma septosporum NZE10]|uniref:5-formyltetrahydrofolate cyclo-ligase n=1 Tax=Dothistroma septosporum (strain NZE10 / CBS 128990) TaxID=675120 RepID=N1PNT7_DOTSN|nr:hypothetical protein DOTSEDRAFT_129178 [Dothistroma septosporum NZE10]